MDVLSVLFEGGVFFDAWWLIMTPIHELGHIIVATCNFVPWYWSEWNKVKVFTWLPGQMFVICIAGYLAKQGFLRR